MYEITYFILTSRILFIIIDWNGGKIIFWENITEDELRRRNFFEPFRLDRSYQFSDTI